MKALRIFAVVLVLLLMLGAGGVTWVLTSEAGARWTVSQAAKRVKPSLSIGRVSGKLTGPLALNDVRYTAPGEAATVQIERVEVDLELTRLFARTLHIRRARVEGAVVTLREEPGRPPAVPALPIPPAGLELPDPPLAMVVDEFSVVGSRVLRGSEKLLEVDRAALAGRWTRTVLALARFELESPQGTVELAGTVTGGRVESAAANGRFRWEVGGVLYAGELKSESREGRQYLDVELRAPFALVLRGALPAGGSREWTALLDVPEFDPRGRLQPADGVITGLGAHLKFSGVDGRAVASGEVRINGETVNLETLEVAPAAESWRIESLVARINGSEATLRASGTLPVAGTQAAASLDLRWDEIAVPEAWTGRVLSTRGELRVAGQADAYSVTGTLALGPPGQLAELELKLEGNREAVRLERLQLNQPGGRLAARGTVWFQPAIRWDVAADAENFDPGEFLPDWRGSLSGRLASTGAFAGDDPGITVEIDALSGTLRDRPVSGRADLVISSARSVSGELQLESGSTRVEISGVAGEKPEATVSLAVASLADWLPKATGGLRADFTVRGEWPHLAIKGSARGDQLGFRDVRVGSVELEADVGDLRALKGSVELKASDVAAVGREFSRLELQAAGEAAAHELILTAKAERQDARVRLAGGMSGERWTGAIEELRLAWADTMDLKLQEPAPLAAGRDGSFELGRACLVDGNIRLCVDGGRSSGGQLHAGISIHDVPLALVELIAPRSIPVALEGQVNAEGRLQQAVDGSWEGEARVASAFARTTLPAAANGEDQPPEKLLLYENLTIDAVLEGDVARATLTAGLIAGGRAEAEFSLGAGEGGSRPIRGRVEARLPNLDPVAALVPEVPGLAGVIEAQAQVTGTLAAPEFTGQVEATGLKAELPRLGLRLVNGTVRIEPGPDGTLKLAGGLASGEGRVALTGAWVPGGKSTFAIKGENFLAADLPSARVVIVPDLQLAHERDGMRLTGQVVVARAAINLQQLPQGRARGHSRDVVVIDREAEEGGRAVLPLTASVVVDLGRETHVKGYGLEARVGGRLTVVESPGTPTTASGEVTVAGTYDGYGQDLRITRGRVLYAGTPIADPRLDITAMRDVEEIKAGIHITGTAQRPEVNVFADPAMGQADALAYLVTGKPISRVGVGKETALVDSAARTLGAAAGAMVGGRIGRQLGIDEVGIEKSDLIDGEVFTVGQYLSPRLYVGYGVGLFDAGDLVTLRYELTETLDLRAVRGPGETRAGIEYRIER